MLKNEIMNYSHFWLLWRHSQLFSFHSNLEMTKTLNTISHASLQAYNSYTKMQKLKLHSLLLAFLNIILPTSCTLIFVVVEFQLQLKCCQVLISNEINSRQSILYLSYRLIIIMSSEMFFHESCNSACHYHSPEFSFCICLQYNITRLLKVLFYPKHRFLTLQVLF